MNKLILTVIFAILIPPLLVLPAKVNVGEVVCQSPDHSFNQEEEENKSKTSGQQSGSREESPASTALELFERGITELADKGNRKSAAKCFARTVEKFPNSEKAD